MTIRSTKTRLSLIACCILFPAIGFGEQITAGTDFPLPSVNETKVASLGIRRIASRHLILYTDLPSSASVDELPHIFDEAVPTWCAYFQVPENHVSKWKNIGCLIRDKVRFAQAGLLPSDLPPFLNGYQRGSQLWWYEQPSEYYRRHLMLHEGTHAFMQAKLGGAGPPWYMEGVAELLATHRWHDKTLTMRYFPGDKTEVPEWGRIKIVRDDHRAGRPKQLPEILNYDAQAHLRVEAYGWCWAACSFFDLHPRYQQPFRELRKFVRDGSASFSERFAERFRNDESILNREWQYFVSQLEYGYDIAREAVEWKPTRNFKSGEAKISLRVDRGWQSTGLRVASGEKYRLTAEGRFQLADQPKAWWCEPNGVTIEYYRGQPLGIVMAAIVDEAGREQSTNGFLSPTAIGLAAVLEPKYAGTLYLRVNDDPTKIADNRGEVTVRIAYK